MASECFERLALTVLTSNDCAPFFVCGRRPLPGLRPTVQDGNDRSLEDDEVTSGKIRSIWREKVDRQVLQVSESSPTIRRRDRGLPDC